MAIMTIEPAETHVLERVIIEGDLSALTPEQRVNYYNEVCRTLSLNGFTKPFEYLRLNNKLTLYATKNCTDQLRSLRGISITQLDVKDGGDYYSVIAYGRDKDGRIDSALASVYVKALSGEARCNAMMKCETKAKRRLTLSMSGLGFMDETEVETVQDARPINVDMETGEVLEQTKRELPGPTLPNPSQGMKTGKPAAEMVDDPQHRLWDRYLQVAGEAEDLGIAFDPLMLPIAKTMLVNEGLRLTAAIKATRQSAEDNAA